MKGLVTYVGALLIGFFGALLATLFTNEALGFLSKLSRFLVERAVMRMPEELREQYREEWLATLEYERRDGKKLSELRAALEAWQGADETSAARAPGLTAETEVEILRTFRDLIVLPLFIVVFYDMTVFGIIGAEATLLSVIPYVLLTVWTTISSIRGSVVWAGLGGKQEGPKRWVLSERGVYKLAIA